jgi:hypothetical protein
MSKVLVEFVDKDTFKHDQIIESVGVWAVLYDLMHFNLKSSHYLDPGVTPKYKKTSFSNPGHARNLRNKLNKQFKTDKFSVIFMKDGHNV